MTPQVGKLEQSTRWAFRVEKWIGKAKRKGDVVVDFFKARGGEFPKPILCGYSFVNNILVYRAGRRKGPGNCGLSWLKRWYRDQEQLWSMPWSLVFRVMWTSKVSNFLSNSPASPFHSSKGATNRWRKIQSNRGPQINRPPRTRFHVRVRQALRIFLEVTMFCCPIRVSTNVAGNWCSYRTNVVGNWYELSGRSDVDFFRRQAEGDPARFSRRGLFPS